MTDKNLNTGEGNAESRNLASKKAREAQDMLRAKIGQETGAALSKRDDATHFAEENLSTVDRAGKFVENVWKSIRENPAFRDVVISDEEMAPIAESVRKDFLKKLTLLDRERATILESINTEYDLSAEQFDVIQENIGAIPSDSLGSYRIASYRNLFLSQFFLRRNESVPVLRKVADRFRKILGTEWNTLDEQSKAALVSAEKNRSMNMANLTHLWSQLSDAARVEMISFLTLNLSFQSLNQLDDYIFSKRKLVQASRRSIEAHLSPKSREMLGKIDDLKLEQVLEGLEWSDVESMNVSRDVILELMSSPSTYVLPRKFTGILQEWFDDELEAQIAEHERKAKEAGEVVSEVSPSYEAISSEWVNKLSRELSEKNNSSIEDAVMFLSPGFLNGTEKLIYQTTPQRKGAATESYVIETDKNRLNSEGKIYSFFRTPLDANGTPNYELREQILSQYLIETVTESSKLALRGEKEFYKELGKDVPDNVFDEAELDRTPANLEALPEAEELQLQLELAASYIEMGMPDGTEELLEEVIAKGNADQVKRAQELLEELRTVSEDGQSIADVLGENYPVLDPNAERTNEKTWTNVNYKPISEEWIQELIRMFEANGATIEGAEQLNSTEFLDGKRKLLVHIVTPTGNKTFQLRTGHYAKDTDGETYGFYAVPVNQNGTLDYVGGKPYLTGEMERLFQDASNIEVTPDLEAETAVEDDDFITRVTTTTTTTVQAGKTTVVTETVTEDRSGNTRTTTETTAGGAGGNASGNQNANAGGAGGGSVPPVGPNNATDAAEEGEPVPQNTGGWVPPNASPSNAEAEPAAPRTLEDFHAALSANFNNSAKLEVGGCISFGKPGTNKYLAYRILSLDENTLTVWGGSNSYPAETIGYDDLYLSGVAKEMKHFKILPNKLGNSAEFLAAMQSESSQKDAWKEIEITTDGDGNEIFDFLDRRFDKNKNKKHYFPGADGTIMEIIAIHDGVAEVRIGENFKKNAKDAKDKDIGPTAEWDDAKEYPLQYVLQYLIRNSCAPWNEPPREIPSREVPQDKMKTTAGTIRGLMGRLSINDIMSGSKKFMEEFKHHLQHGSHLQEQRVMLAIAKKTGMNSWNSEWYADFKSQYENGEKKLIEERLETLGKMGTPDRQKSIRASLFNNGTHDYDHWTNALSMVEKHGHLYAGELRDLEGSWMFFKRIAGIPLGDDVNDYKEFQHVVSVIRRKGVDNITEEAVLEEYMKIHPEFPNAQIWRMLKKKVKEGTDNEQKSGGDEAEQFINLEQRLNYAMGKFESKEYAHAIGAMEKIFDKEGSAHKKQTIAFMLAMSRIPERLPRPLLDRFVKIFDEGRLHSPALMFIKDRQSQEKFRDAVKAIAKVKAEQQRAAGVTSPSIEKDFDNMIKAVGKNTDVLKEYKKGGEGSKFDTGMFSAVKSFWDKHGKDIQYELTGNPKGTVLISQRALDENPALAAYKAIVKKQLGDTTLHHPTELDKGTPFMDGEEGAGVISFKPDKIIDKMGLQGHHGGFSGSNLDRAIQADFRASMEEIRDKDASIMDENDKRVWFKNIYVEYVEKIKATSNLAHFLEQPTVKPFNELGLMPPTEVDQVELQREINRLKALFQAEQEAMADKKSELERIQNAIPAGTNPTEIQKQNISRINKEIVERNMKSADLQKQIGAVEANKGKYVSHEEGNSRHMAHFEAMFQKFLRSGRTTGGVRGRTQEEISRTLGLGEAPESTGNEQTNPNDYS